MISKQLLANKKVAFDLDGVCFNFVDKYLEFINKHLRMDVQRRRVSTYYLEQCTWDNSNPIISAEDNKRLLKKFIYCGKFLELELVPGCREFIYELKHDYACDICFITSRHETAREDTFESLQKNGLGNIPIWFSFESNPKHKIVTKLGTDYIFEDCPKYVKEINELTSCKAIWFNDENLLWEDVPKMKEYVQINNWREIE